MFKATMDRTAARRMTLAMLGVAALGVGAAGALGVGGKGRLPEPPERSAGPAEIPAQTRATDGAEAVDPATYADDISWALSYAYDWEPEAPDGEPETPGRTGGSEDRAVAMETPVKYLGSIIGPDRRLAIVSIDGRQRILAEGAQAEGLTLVSVSEDGIEIRRNGGTERIDKAQPGASMVTVIAGSPASSPGSGGGGSDDAREEAESKIDRMERMRQEARERRERALEADDRDAYLEALRQRGASVEDGVVSAPGADGVTRTVTPGNSREGGTGGSGSRNDR